MRTKLLLVLLILEVFVYAFYKPKKYMNLKHTIYKNDKINIDGIKLENYVIGVVAAEMPATFSFEALKAQAVASRTFAYNKIINNKINYDNLTLDKGQAYITIDEMKRKWNDSFESYYLKIKKAVKETQGEIIIYNNKPINAYYFSSSNGYTEDSKNVFGEEEYLVSVESKMDLNSKEYYAEKIINIDMFKEKLNITGEGINISDIKKSNTNHVEYLNINGVNIKGIDFRKKLELRSTDFDIEIINSDVKITTRGYGHGVGMSQTGANYLALDGMKYNEIINYFYKNVSIKKYKYI